MMKRISTLLTVTAVAALGCSSSNPPLTGKPLPPPPAIERPTVELTDDGVAVSYDPRVDILFVIDDSLSMYKHHENLSRNIHRFVEAISKVERIDFHIGFTVSHDRGRYGQGLAVPEKCAGGQDQNPVPEICVDPVKGVGPCKDGKVRPRPAVNWALPGTLQPLLGPAEKLPKDGRRFVTREDAYTEILSASLDPKKNRELVKLLLPNRDFPTACGYGPEEEELFTPLLGAVETPLAPNKGFRRDGAFFVAIIVSDAKDASGLTPEQVALRLANITGETKTNKKRFRVFSVAMKPGDRIGGRCQTDPAFWRVTGYNDRGEPLYDHRDGEKIADDENPLATLASLTSDDAEGGQVLSICDSNYGDTLAKYGAQVQQDALPDVEIELPTYPAEFTSVQDQDRNLSVWVGNKKLAQGTSEKDGQWSYSKRTKTVTVYGKKVDWDKNPGEKIHVRFVPADATESTTKPAVPIGGDAIATEEPATLPSTVPLPRERPDRP